MTLQEEYGSYEKTLTIMDLETLDKKQQIVCIEFAKKCLKSDKMKKP